MLPADAAIRLPARAPGHGRDQYQERSRNRGHAGTLGLYFADDRRAATASDLVLEAKPAARKLRASARLTADTRVWAVHPGCHPRPRVRRSLRPDA